MLILGIDSSGICCTAALSENDKIIDSFSIYSGKSHSECLLPEIEKMLENNDITVSMLDRIAISCGPGSYTGLRIGISTVKGLAVTDNIPCISISSLEALCYNSDFEDGTIVSAMLDARRDEFYQAFFEIKDGKALRLCEDRSILFDDLILETEKYQNVVIIGDGAKKFLSFSKKNFSTVADDLNYGSGKSVCISAYLSKDKTLSCRELKPEYLKLSQAEREYMNKCEVKK